MNTKTIFNGSKVVFDAMVIINFHSVLALDSLVDWAKGEIVIERYLKEKEIQYSKIGQIDLSPYIDSGAIILEEIKGYEQERLFFYYLKSTLGRTKIHKGEASCLALAISNSYGLASDEKAVREEFRRKCQGKICVSSWMIVDKAVSLGLISEQEAAGLKKGFFYV